jgi:quinol monooxygenase YgiN
MRSSMLAIEYCKINGVIAKLQADSVRIMSRRARAVASAGRRVLAWILTGGPRRPPQHQRRRPMIHVLAIITAKPGMRDAVLAAFRANMPAVHAETGCIEYGPAIDAVGMGAIQTALGADTFVVIEKWASADDLKAHGAAPHMKAYAAKVKDMLASRVIHVLSPAV